MRKSSKISGDQRFDVTHEHYDSTEKPNYGKAALCVFGAAGLLLLICVIPWKSKVLWQTVVHMGRTVFAGGRHVQRPDGEKEIFD